MSEHEGGHVADLAMSYDRPDEQTEASLTRIYLAILQQPRPERALLVAQGIPEETVDRAIPILASRGLVTVRPDRTWDVISPDIALPAHAVELESRARSVRGAAHELAQVYFQARSSTRSPMEGVRVLHSLDEIHTASADIVSAARTSVLAMRDRSAGTEQLFAAPMSAHREKSLASDGGPLDIRTTFDLAVLEIDGAGEVLLARAEGGEKARFVNGLPFSALVVDEDAALVDLTTHDAGGQGSLLVRSRPLVLGLQSLLQAAWRLGVPLDRVGSDGVDRRDLQILSLLAAGSSDATIARHSRTSLRTVERRVRALMDQLGAGTRFQAGVQAARRGWI